MLTSFGSLPPKKQAKLLRTVAEETGADVARVQAVADRHWSVIARPKQLPPEGAWTYWAIIAGRGFGKTLTGAQWTATEALEQPGIRIGLVAPTIADVRDTMVEGETGLLSVLPADALRGQSRASAWNRSQMELVLANGSRCKGFSSVEPDRLRGPQHHRVWGEEFSSWKDAHRGDALETTWSNIKLGCRLGDHPRIMLTSTPKPNRLTTDILGIDPEQIAIVRGTSYENRANLSEAWWETVVSPYEGTRLGLQEIHGEVLEDVEGALWTRELLDITRVDPRDVPDLARIVVGVDPNASSDEAANNAGIVVVGRDARPQPHGYVLADRTITRGGPRAWAQAAVDAYHELSADRIVAEKNNGGEMVGIMIETVDSSVPVKLVSASRGKRTRAEPISALYEGSETVPRRIHHAGYFPALEAEMTTWTPEAESPDRMDALVWALTELLLQPTQTIKSSVPRGRIPGVMDRGRASQGF